MGVKIHLALLTEGMRSHLFVVVLLWSSLIIMFRNFGFLF